MTNPLENTPTPIIADLTALYQKANEELYTLESYAPPTYDLSPEAAAVRAAISDRHRVLRALAAAMAGRCPGRVGEHLLPLGAPLLSLN